MVKERIDIELTKGSSPQEGWGTGLKPAQELICMARKPISEKTITDNVLRWGTGGINVDGCRIGTDDNLGGGAYTSKNNMGDFKQPEGRFPANIILDEEAAKALDNQSGFLKGDSPNRKPRIGGHREKYVGTDENKVKNKVIVDKVFDSGGASKFFYVAKVSSKERNMGLGEGFEEKETNGSIGLHSVGGSPTKDNKRVMKNFHPTVKPINLLIYLVRLVTPTNGIVLDPYMGSGSTGIASQLEGFDFIGMEMDEDYFKIASERISKWEEYKKLIKK